MADFALALFSAFWLGILTSISPCPLTTNIAAMSFVGRKVGHPRLVFFTGALYACGRALAYTALGVLLVHSLLSAPALSHSLQKYMNLALGPVLILVGMVLLDMVHLNLGYGGCSVGLQNKIEKMGFGGALLLGFLFALSFCPTSAALFFGSLLPLAIKTQSSLVIPLVYGLASGVPVLLFASLIALGVHKVAATYNRIVVFELWARKITGAFFIVVGLYYSLTLIFGLSLP